MIRFIDNKTSLEYIVVQDYKLFYVVENVITKVRTRLHKSTLTNYTKLG